MNTNFKPRVIPKTTSYSLNPARPDSSGTMFTNRGATGAVTFTLPAPSAPMAGLNYRFISCVAQNLIVSAGTGKAVALGNATAASLAANSIGSVIAARCDGTSWVLTGETVGVTYTVA